MDKILENHMLDLLSAAKELVDANRDYIESAERYSKAYDLVNVRVTQLENVYTDYKTRAVADDRLKVEDIRKMRLYC